MATIASLKRIPAKTLVEMMIAEPGPADERSFAIVDARDDDYIGGHIFGSINCPSRVLPGMMPGLVRRLRDKKTVVFHCALSQQRGPGAALKYAREREEILGGGKEKEKEAVKVGEGNEGEDDTEEKQADEGDRRGDGVDRQEILVLDRGFVGWQEVYGENEQLTEAYRKELWKDGYWA